MTKTNTPVLMTREQVSNYINLMEDLSPSETVNLQSCLFNNLGSPKEFVKVELKLRDFICKNILKEDSFDKGKEFYVSVDDQKARDFVFDFLEVFSWKFKRTIFEREHVYGEDEEFIFILSHEKQKLSDRIFSRFGNLITEVRFRISKINHLEGIPYNFIVRTNDLNIFFENGQVSFEEKNKLTSEN